MHLCIYNVCCNANAFLGKIVYIFKDLYMCEKWCEIKKMLEGFDKFYWNSEMVNNISLINDLRLSTNIHETAHSRILYKLLCAHGKEPRQFLKLFLKTVELSDLDLEQVKIRVEYKHIDVLISDGEKFIIIENKVNHACDQDRQLMTYINDDEWKGKDVFVLYLVRSDEDEHPSEKSLKRSEREKLKKEGKYKKISYQRHILKWLCRCEEKIIIENVLLKSALVQYRDYIEGLFVKMECMTDKDYREFEEKVLNISVPTDYFVDPIKNYTKAKELSNKTIELSKAIKLYKKTLCDRYLECFKSKTDIKNASLNKDLNIEFYIQIGESKVRFTYDFLKKEDPYVWFGAEYPLKGEDGKKIENSDDIKKIIEKNLPEGYKLDNQNNCQDCDDKGFKHFYSDEKWFCKFCKDNKNAMTEIKGYIDMIAKLVCKE